MRLVFAWWVPLDIIEDTWKTTNGFKKFSVAMLCSRETEDETMAYNHEDEGKKWAFS